MKRFTGRTATEELCEWANIPRSSYYYRARPGRRGSRPSTHTPKNGAAVLNEEVVSQIREILARPYCAYGYQMVTTELRGLGYGINKKKTYRLMKEYRLLCGKRIRSQGKRQWVRYRRIKAEKPMQYICLDIKHVWVAGEGRWYYQLAIIDVYSRMILHWIFQPSIRQADVIAMLRLLDLRYGLKGVIVRNDNGSQFIANKVRQMLRDMEARQEFTHVATPEENAYIEAFHSIQQRELIDPYRFSSYYDAKRHIEGYVRWYNQCRRHGSLGGITPVEKWAQGGALAPLRPPDARAPEGLSRPADSFENEQENQPLAASLDKAASQAYLCQSGDKAEGREIRNSLDNSVQRIGG